MPDDIPAKFSGLLAYVVLVVSAGLGSFGDILLFDWARRRGGWYLASGLGLWLVSLVLFALLFRYSQLPFAATVVVFVVIHILIDLAWDVFVFGGHLSFLQGLGMVLALAAVVLLQFGKQQA